jgi:AraC-like DNA-binding protein
VDYIEILQEMLRYIDTHIREKLNVEKLAARAGFSPYHFCRVFQWEVGYSIMEYVRNRRKKDLSLIIAKSRYDEALRSLDRPHIYRENGQRMKALADRGVTVNETGGTCYISCKTAPKMFLGLRVLCSAPEGKYKYMNYLRLDYKGCLGDMPGIEDVKTTMKNITKTGRKLENDPELFDWFCGRFPERLCKCPSNRAEIINPGKGDIQKCMAITKIFRKDIL